MPDELGTVKVSLREFASGRRLNLHDACSLHMRVAS
jgi:hypothetical protein